MYRSIGPWIEERSVSNQSGKTVEPVPAWARGVWRRNSMRDASGLVDHTTQVYWAQTPTLFADVRIPADRPDKAGQTSLADYDDDELLQLARQQGFAGSLPIDGQIFRWRRFCGCTVVIR